jgi:uncharacterized membrane protein YfhO
MAYGAGEIYPHQILNKPFVAEPNSCCTETYLLIGPFPSEKIAKNVVSYIQTKFFRFLVLNDLYESNWKAYANNHELRIYPTNVVMRGIFLPPGATEINMQYRPIITRWWSLLFPMGGIFLLFIILFFKRKCTT